MQGESLRLPMSLGCLLLVATGLQLADGREVASGFSLRSVLDLC